MIERTFMSSIQVEDDVRAALEANAAARGLSLSNYLALLARQETSAKTPSNTDSLAELLCPIIAEAKGKVLHPRTPPCDASKSQFHEIMTEKYRKQGFNV